MAKQRKGESVSLYLETGLNEYLDKTAERLKQSKSEIINNMLRNYKCLSDNEHKIADAHLISS